MLTQQLPKYPAPDLSCWSVSAQPMAAALLEWLRASCCSGLQLAAPRLDLVCSDALLHAATWPRRQRLQPLLCHGPSSLLWVALPFQALPWWSACSFQSRWVQPSPSAGRIPLLFWPFMAWQYVSLNNKRPQAAVLAAVCLSARQCALAGSRQPHGRRGSGQCGQPADLRHLGGTLQQRRGRHCVHRSPCGEAGCCTGCSA